MKQCRINVFFASFLALVGFFGFAKMSAAPVHEGTSKEVNQTSSLLRQAPPGSANFSTPRQLSQKTDNESRTPLMGKKMAVMSSAKASSIVNPIYGCMLYNSTWGAADITHTEYGMYSFTNRKSDGVTKLKEGPYANYGGVFVNGKYYANYVDLIAYGTFSSHYLYTYNPDTWDIEKAVEMSLTSSVGMTMDMTYDMTTNNVYVITYLDEMDYTTYIRKEALATLNLETGEISIIGECGRLATLSADGNGQLWAIDLDGYIRKVNKNTGELGEQLFKVADYSMDISGNNNAYIQSAEFDYESGKLYWAATTGYCDNVVYVFGHLYEIDVNEQTVTQLYQFEGDAEWGGIFLKNKMPAAPGRIENLHFEYASEGSCDGTIQFNAPSTTYDRKTLTGTVDVTMSVDGKVVATQEGVNPGELVTSQSMSFTDNKRHEISVVTKNTVGEGPEATTSAFGGVDTPAAVTNLQLTTNDAGESILTWEAPQLGVNGGYLDQERLNYSIVRYPDKITVATGVKETTFTEKINKDIDLYYYKVTSYSNKTVGKAATSNKLKLGNPCILPYSNSFSTPTCLDVWTIIDANGDGDVESFYGPNWKWDETYSALMYYTDTTNSADDWAITPPMAMTKDKVYRVSFTSSSEKGTYDTKVRVTRGNAPTVAAQKTTIWDEPYKAIPSNPSQISKNFKIDTDEPQYIGFYNYSAALTDLTYIFAMKVEAVGTMASPDSISNLSMTRADKGAYRATLKFKAPSKNVGGTVLTEASTIYISRNGNQVATLSNVGAGEDVEWIDTNAAQGMNHYRLIAGNSTGIGFEVEDSVFVGQDVPLTVSNVAAKCDNVNNAIVTWDAPEGNVGMNGYYVDPAKLKYAIYRYSNSATKLIATNVSGCKYYDASIDMGGTEQSYVDYLVTAVSAEGEGEAMMSNYILVGNALSLPYDEDFGTAHDVVAPWLTTDVFYSLWWGDAVGTNPTAESYNTNIGGLMSFRGRGEPWHSSARYLSPRFNLSELDNPELSFYVYHVNADSISGFNDRIVVEAVSDDFPYTQIGEPVLLKSDETGWKKHTISLNAYKNCDRVSISFKGINESRLCNIHLDCIHLGGTAYDYELKTIKLEGAEETKVGTSEAYTVTVKNIGTESNNFKIELYRDGKLIGRKTVDNIDAGVTENYGFYYTAKAIEAGDAIHEIYAKIITEKDQYEGNNISNVVKQKVYAENLPYVTDLAATTNDGGSVHLSWSEPTQTPYENVKTDDMESYTPFTIDNIGKYKVFDGDGAVPYGFSDGSGGQIEWPNYRSPQAWIVFNPSQLSIGSSSVSPYSGNQCLVSFASTSSKGNDDWLISPKLSGSAQTISFYAKACTSYYTEQFQVLASSTDTNVGSFKSVSGSYSVQPTSAWQEYTYELPAGTKYFAIRNTSVDAYALLVDDISFESEAEIVDLLGFNVYCNDAKLTSEPIGETDFDQSGLDFENNGYAYRVSAVYEQGESMLSDKALVGYFSAVGNVDVDANDINVYGGKECINVTNVSNAIVEIYSIDGVDKGKYQAASMLRIPIESGIYIVKINGKTCKVLVK